MHTVDTRLIGKPGSVSGKEAGVHGCVWWRHLGGSACSRTWKRKCEQRSDPPVQSPVYRLRCSRGERKRNSPKSYTDMGTSCGDGWYKITSRNKQRDMQRLSVQMDMTDSMAALENDTRVSVNVRDFDRRRVGRSQDWDCDEIHPERTPVAQKFVDCADWRAEITESSCPTSRRGRRSLWEMEGVRWDEMRHYPPSHPVSVRQSRNNQPTTMTMPMTMTHSEKSVQQSLEAWPYRHKRRGRDPAKKSVTIDVACSVGKVCTYTLLMTACSTSNIRETGKDKINTGCCWNEFSEFKSLEYSDSEQRVKEGHGDPRSGRQQENRRKRVAGIVAHQSTLIAFHLSWAELGGTYFAFSLGRGRDRSCQSWLFIK